MTTVHQILFGWAERDHEGNAGVRPLANSGAPTIDRWAGRLEYVWATQEDTRDESDPSASLVHLVFEDEAAVLRKLPSRNVHGRGGATLTHALVGDRQSIDARLALGLHDWPGWREHERGGTQAALEPLDLAALRHSAEPGLVALRTQVADIPADQLTALVSRVLAEPSADFTVITRPGLALPMMTALLDIVGGVPGRPWTFAGRESTDVGGHQPRVVFLPARPPQSMYVSKRVRVEPAVPVDIEGSPFAAQVVDLYRTAGAAAVERTRSRITLSGGEDVAEWRRTVKIVDGRIVDPRPHCDALVDDDFLETLAVGGSLPSVRAGLVGELRDRPADWLVRVLERWHRNAPRTVRHPGLREIVLSEAVQACLTRDAPRVLVRATAQARPWAPTVAEAFLSQVPREGLDLDSADQAELLRTALDLGLEAAELEREGLLGPTPATVVVDLVAESAENHPDAAYAVLHRHLAPGRHERGPRSGVAEVWFEHNLLLSQVERIAGDDRARELDCYRLLLTAVYGAHLNGHDAADLVRRGGSRAPAGLLSAAVELAGDEEARWRIHYEAGERYFRESGYSLTAPPAQGRPSRQASGWDSAGHGGGHGQPAGARGGDSWGPDPYGRGAEASWRGADPYARGADPYRAGADPYQGGAPYRGSPDRIGPPSRGGTSQSAAPEVPAARADWGPPAPRSDGHGPDRHHPQVPRPQDPAPHGHAPPQAGRDGRGPRDPGRNRSQRSLLGHMDGVTLLFVSLCAAVVVVTVAYIVLTTVV